MQANILSAVHAAMLTSPTAVHTERQAKQENNIMCRHASVVRGIYSASPNGLLALQHGRLQLLL